MRAPIRSCSTGAVLALPIAIAAWALALILIF